MNESIAVEYILDIFDNEILLSFWLFYMVYKSWLDFLISTHLKMVGCLMIYWGLDDKMPLLTVCS